MSCKESSVVNVWQTRTITACPQPYATLSSVSHDFSPALSPAQSPVCPVFSPARAPVAAGGARVDSSILQKSADDEEGFLSEDVKRTRESPPQLVLQQQENVDATTGTIVDGADRTVEGDTDGALQPQVQQDGNPNTAAKWESLVSIGDDSKSTFEQPRAANSGATTSTGGIMMRMATTTTTALLCLAMLFQ